MNAVAPMTFSSCTTTQPLTTSVTKCGLGEQIICVQIVTAGTTSPLSATQFQINMTGSTNNNMSDITLIHIYYTGTSSTFSTINDFGTATPASGTITINGSQSLGTGTNYFWVAYDMTGTTATVGNVLDAQCTQLTVTSARTPTATNPAGTRTIAACTTSPGGISTGLAYWIKASAGTSSTTDGAAISSWNDQSGNSRNAAQATAAQKPTYKDNSTDNINFNPEVYFDDDNVNATGNADYMDIATSGMLPSGDGQYTVYTVIKPEAHNKTLATYGGHFFFSGDQSGAGKNIALGVGSTAYTYVCTDDWWGNNLASSSNVLSAGYPLLATYNYLSYSTTVATRTKQIFVSGTSVGSASATVRSSVMTYSELGVTRSSSALTDFYQGGILEIATYPSLSHGSTNVRKRIESYFGIKYGITIPNDYTSSLGATVWSQTTNASYNNSIIGLARDDNSGLSQKQAKTTGSTTDVLTVYIGSSKVANQANNDGAFSGGDQSFFMVGNNGAAVKETVWPHPETPSGICCRLQREWLVQKTNFTNTDLKLEFDLTGENVDNITASDLRLLVDADGDFTNATILGSPTITAAVTRKRPEPVIVMAGTVVTVTIDASNFTGTPYFTLASVSSTTTLPITLTYFNATPEGQHVYTEWRTETEVNNDYFVVEKSRDGINFEFVGQVKGAGNSSRVLDYSFVDDSPYVGISYYRLKQVDYDGHFTYSERAVVDMKLDNEFIVFPNPAVYKDITWLSMSGIDPDKEVLVVLYDVHGREFYSQVLITSSTGKTLIGIDPSAGLVPGVYIIIATSNNQIYRRSIVIF